MENWKERARADAAQDAMENAPFASVGGVERRDSMIPPAWAEGHEAEYLEAYREAAQAMYGVDWCTCGFGWAPALTIPGSDDETDAPAV